MEQIAQRGRGGSLKTSEIQLDKFQGRVMVSPAQLCQPQGPSERAFIARVMGMS